MSGRQTLAIDSRRDRSGQVTRSMIPNLSGLRSKEVWQIVIRAERFLQFSWSRQLGVSRLIVHRRVLTNDNSRQIVHRESLTINFAF